jgi:hypothetical protein
MVSSSVYSFNFFFPPIISICARSSSHPVVDSDDGLTQRYASSVTSHFTTPLQPMPTGYADPYPAWSGEKQIPISYEEIEDIFLDLTQKFGFQRDSMRNQVRLC